jgi:hypothetical protein
VLLVVDKPEVSLPSDVTSESILEIMPALVRKPASMDVCMTKSFSLPDSYVSRTLALKKSSQEERLFHICPFYPGLVYLFFL